MRAEAAARRAWLAVACLLSAVLLSGVFLARTAQPSRPPRSADGPAPKVPALAPGSQLPPGTPAFSPLGPNLTGRVLSSRGDPIAGARVFIDAAGPRVGRGYT